MKIAFTIDFEDWYQGIDLPFANWKNLEKRLHIGHYKLLELFQKANVKAKNKKRPGRVLGRFVVSYILKGVDILHFQLL